MAGKKFATIERQSTSLRVLATTRRQKLYIGLTQLVDTPVHSTTRYDRRYAANVRLRAKSRRWQMAWRVVSAGGPWSG
jgi:hypothetical protein